MVTRSDPTNCDSAQLQNHSPSSGPIKGFYISHRAYYQRTDDSREIMIGLFYPAGGCDFEFAIRWRDIGAAKLVPQLQVFDDSWRGLFKMTELHGIAEFTNKNVDDQAIIDFLLAAGFVDLTKYQGPKSLKPFSVLLLYPEGDHEDRTETYLAHVHAADKKQAIMDAREEAVRVHDWDEEHENGFVVLFVSEGHLVDIRETL